MKDQYEPTKIDLSEISEKIIADPISEKTQKKQNRLLLVSFFLVLIGLRLVDFNQLSVIGITGTLDNINAFIVFVSIICIAMTVDFSASYSQDLKIYRFSALSGAKKFRMRTKEVLASQIYLNQEINKIAGERKIIAEKSQMLFEEAFSTYRNYSKKIEKAMENVDPASFRGRKELNDIFDQKKKSDDEWNEKYDEMENNYQIKKRGQELDKIMNDIFDGLSEIRMENRTHSLLVSDQYSMGRIRFIFFYLSTIIISTLAVVMAIAVGVLGLFDGVLMPSQTLTPIT